MMRLFVIYETGKKSYDCYRKITWVKCNAICIIMEVLNIIPNKLSLGLSLTHTY